MDAPRLLRPVKTKGQYGNWTQYASDGEVSEAMVSGRGVGRISRRRKRQQALKEREFAKRAVKLDRRRKAKEAMELALAGQERGSAEHAASATNAVDRMAQLRALRERLIAKSDV